MNLLHVDRLIDSICQTICAKENYEELCGDLLAIRIITQNDIPIPTPILKDLLLCMKTVLTRFKEEFAALEGECNLNQISFLNRSSNSSNLFVFLTADDTTPPPPKKQRKLSTPPNSEHGDDAAASKSQSKREDENSNVTKSTASDCTPEDIVMNEAKPSTSAAFTHEIERKNLAEIKTNEANEVKAMTIMNAAQSASSISPSNSSSSEYELHVEKNVERKLLRKIEYILMDVIQYLNELENEHLGSSSSSSQNANTSGTSIASSISNNEVAPTPDASVTTITSSAMATIDGSTQNIHNEEITTNIVQHNDATTTTDSNAKVSSD